MVNKQGKAKKEELLVGIAAPDNTLIEYNEVSRYLGMKMPFKNPKTTCALRVTSEVASFSLLHLTKASSQKIIDKPLELPRGPLIKLEKLAKSIENINGNFIHLFLNDSKYVFSYTADKNNVITLDGEVSNFELPKSAIQAQIFFKSPVVDRIIALGFIGHLGKPGDPDNNIRVASKIIRSALLVNHFKALTGFESVDVPPSPRLGGVRFNRKASDRAQLSIPVFLWSNEETPSQIASGDVLVDINLDIPGHGNNKFLFEMTPSKSTEEFFDSYRFACSEALNYAFMQNLGPQEISSISADIALGEVTTGTVLKLKDILLTLSSGINLTPTKFHIVSK